MAAANPLPHAPLPSPAPAVEDPNSPEALAVATAKLRALGVEDDIVFTAQTVEELRKYLGTIEPAYAPST